MAIKELLTDRSKRQVYAHYLAGMIILIHACDNYYSGVHAWQFFAAAGLMIIAVAAFHHPVQRKVPGINGIFFVIEGLLSLIIAWDLFELGKKALPLAYLVLGLFQFYLAVKKYKKAIPIESL
jgi:hypothetical protein